MWSVCTPLNTCCLLFQILIISGTSKSASSGSTREFYNETIACCSEIDLSDTTDEMGSAAACASHPFGSDATCEPDLRSNITRDASSVNATTGRRPDARRLLVGTSPALPRDEWVQQPTVRVFKAVLDQLRHVAVRACALYLQRQPITASQ